MNKILPVKVILLEPYEEMWLSFKFDNRTIDKVYYISII